MSDPQNPERRRPADGPSSTPTSRSRSPAPSRPRAPQRPAEARATAAADVPPPSRWHTMLHQIATGNAIISVLAVLLALIVGAIMIAFTDERVQEASGYFFARPGDTLRRDLGIRVSGAYAALFQGSVYNFRRDTTSSPASGRSPRRSRSRRRSSPVASASASRSASACSTSVAAARC